MTNRQTSFRALAAIITLTVVGAACAAYVLVNQRLSVPFTSTYSIHTRLASADGVAPGLGQPVLVSGVRVGVISAARVERGTARVTLEIRRDKLARLYRDARASLSPSTPLKDMQVDLDPGTPAAGAVDDGSDLPIQRTRVPVELDAILSALDADTRDYLTSMIASLGEGLDSQGRGLRGMLTSFGATTKQLRTISSELAQRRRAIAQLVHNVGDVSRAASQDRRLASLVLAGQRTLSAVGRQDAALRASIQALPGSLGEVGTALDATAKLSANLRGAAVALRPSLDRLPQTLRAFTPFAEEAATALRSEIRPVARELQPILRDIGPAVERLDSARPAVRRVAKLLTYTVNELVHNPPGDDEGYLYWLSWFAHIANSSFSTQDAHGSMGRASVLVSCQQLTDLSSLGPILSLATGTASVCP